MSNSFSHQISLTNPKYKLIEELELGTQTRVYRAFQLHENHSKKTPSSKIVRIEVLRSPYASREDLTYLKHIYGVLKDLTIPHVTKVLALEPWGNNYALIWEDVEGISLSDFWGNSVNLSIEQSLTIALQLVDILHVLGHHKIIHQNINPNSIFINPETSQIWLINFSLASLLPQEHQSIQPPNYLRNNLAYLAPEQTGRMNRRVDFRADFYGLGATLYQLLSNQLPFLASDPIKLIYDHLATVPTPPYQVNHRVPVQLSAIALKLMAKNAEDRYQSALGIKYDLEKCWQQWQENNQIEEFALGTKDKRDRFIIPDKLYGRKAEAKVLLDSFDRVAQGSSELMLIAGFSGIGKTAVINEVHKPITRQNGYFIKGKFDQPNRNIPFSAFVRAFSSLIKQLASESNKNLKQWKQKILDALGNNAQVIIEVIPNLEIILGKQPEVPTLSGSAAENRFNLLFKKFVRVFCLQEHPLVIFLDDLQWADSASLKLIKLLMGDLEQEYLLVLGAYRDNEVYADHPLMLTLEEIERSPASINTITLNSLSQASINNLVVDSLHCVNEEGQSLSEFIYRHTEGNPFFTRQFLKGLYEANYLKFNSFQKTWQYNLSQLFDLQLSDDVVQFMVARLQQLPVATQEILKFAACIGNRFKLKTLAVICESTEIDISRDLLSALQIGLIVPESHIPRLYGEDESEHIAQNNFIEYRFLHDRVQQAAYSLISDLNRSNIHLKLAQTLQQTYGLNTLEQTIFEIINHYNQVNLANLDEEQLWRLVQLNLQAGKQAKLATAFENAESYFESALDLIVQLEAQPWQSHYELMFELYVDLIKVKNARLLWHESKRASQALYNHSRDRLDKSVSLQLLIEISTQKGAFDTAIKYGQEALELLDEQIPETDFPNILQNIIITIRQQADAIALLKQGQFKTLEDKRLKRVLAILSSLDAATYVALPALWQVINALSVKITLSHGITSESVAGLARYGQILCGQLNGSYDEGLTFGQIALKLSELFYPEQKGLVCFGMGLAINHWSEPLSKNVEFFQLGFQAAMECGIILYADYNLMFQPYYSHYMGLKLSKNITSIQKHIEFIVHTQNSLADILLSGLLPHLQLLSAKMSLEDWHSFRDAFSQEAEKQKNNLALAMHALTAGQVDFLLGDWKRAAVSFSLVSSLRFTLLGYFSLIELTFYHGLLLLQINSPDIANQSQISSIIRNLQYWAEQNQSNCGHKYDLVEAEKNRVLGNKLAALELYDQAIAGAKENQYLQEEALANELAAKFYLDWGKDKVAAGYMQEAYECYALWGAKTKTKQLEEKYPELLSPILRSQYSAFDPLETLSSLSKYDQTNHQIDPVNFNLNDTFDLTAILKSARTITETLELDKLLKQLSEIILHNSGCDRIIFALNDHHGDWQINVNGSAEHIAINLKPTQTSLENPFKLINYVNHTQEIVVVNNLATDLPIIDDYLLEQQPKSIFATPLKYQDEVIGVLYLHSAQIQSLFNPEKITILEFLCAQAAIALRNAQLFADANLKSEVIESSIDGMAILDNGQFTYLNQRHLDFYGYESEELIGQSWQQLYSAEEVNRLQKIIFTSLANRGDWSGEATALRKDGTTFPEEIRIFALDDGKQICICRDITRRKQIEQNLIASEERFKGFFKQNADALVLLGQDGIIDCNQAAVDLFGYQDKSQLLNIQPYDLSPATQPDGQSSQKKVQYVCQQAINQKGYKFEWVHQRLNGKNFWTEINLTAINYRDELIFHGLVRDISNRKELEKEQDRLIQILQSTSDFVGIYKPYQGILWQNQPFIKLRPDLNIEDEVIPVSRLYPQWAFEIIKNEGVPAAIEQGTWSGESALLNPDGAEIPTSQVIIAHKSEQGEVEYLSTILRDISDRKLAEQKIQESERKFRTLISNLGGIVYRCLGDENWTIAYCSPASTELLGYPPEHFIDSPIHVYQKMIHPEDLDFVVQSVRKALETRVSFHLEYRIIHRDGTVHYVEEKGKGIYDHQGNLECFEGVLFDISDRKATEQALKESENKFRTLVSNVHGAVYRCSHDAQWTIDFVSSAIEDLSGYPADEFIQNRIRSFASIAHPDDYELIHQKVDAAIKNHHSYAYEYRLIHRDGSIRWVVERGKGIYDQAGNFLHVEGVIFDISDRKAAEEAVRKSKRRYASLAAAAPVGIFRTDAEGKCLYVNERSCEIVGLSPEDSLGEGWSNRLHEDDRDKVVSEWNKSVAEERPFKLEYRFKRPDGSITWVFGQSVAERNSEGQIIGFLGTVTDISDRQAAEEALKLSEARAKAAFEQAAVGVVDADLNGQLIRVNEHFCQMIGYQQSELATFSFKDVTHPDDCETSTEYMKQLRSGELPDFTLEKRYVRKDGSIFWAATTVSLINIPGEKARGNIAIIKDISDRKKLEQEQQRLINILETTSDYIGFADAQQNTIWHNKQLRDLRPDLTESPKGESIAAIHPPWANEILANEALPTVIESSTWSGETALLDGEGNEIPVSQVVMAHKDSEGQVEYFSTIMRDISDRKAMERQLEFTQYGLDHAADCFYCLDADAKIIQVNQATCERTGYSKSEILGMTIHDIAPTCPKESTWEPHWEKLKRLKSYSFETVHQTASGEIYPVEVVCNYLEFDGKAYSFDLVRDITERKLAEAELKASESRFRKAIENAPFPIMIHAEDSEVLQISSTWTEITGYSPNDIPTTKAWANLAYDDQAENILENVINKKYSLTSRSDEGELNISAKDGSQLIWQFSSAPFGALPDGRKVVISMAVDVTQRRQAETALIQKQNHLTALLDNIPHIAWIKDEQSRFIAVNQPFAQACGNPLEDLVGKTDYDIWPSELAQGYHDDDFEVLRSGKRKVIEEQVALANGTRGWLETTKTPFKNHNGEFAGTVGIATDLTERKQAELALAESEAKFRTLVENATDIIFSITLDGTFTYVSPQVEAILGYRAEQLIGQNFKLFTHPEDIYIVIGCIRVSRRKRISAEERTIRMPHVSGGWRKILFTNTPVRDTSGKVVSIQGIGRDVTEKDQQEQTLTAIVEGTAAKTGADFYQACVRYLADIFQVQYGFLAKLNPESAANSTMLVLWNGQEFIEPYEVDLTDTPCLKTYEENIYIVYDSLNKLFPETEQIALLEGESYASVKIFNSQGQGVANLGIIDTKPLPKNSANIEFILQLFATRVGAEMERQETEDALRKSQAQFRRMTENVPGMIFRYVVHPDGNDEITYISSQVREICEVEPETVLRNADSMWNRIHPDDVSRISQEIEISAKTLQPFFNSYRLILPQKGLRWVQNMSRPERLDNGDVVWDGVMFDITDRKQVEQQLQQTNEELIRATRMKDEFLANMSHELRTPLNAILGMAESLQEEIFGKMNLQQVQAISTIEQSASHLLELIDDILDLTKIESGRVELDYSSVELNQLCQSSLTFIKQQAQKKLIQLHLNMPFNLPNIEIDQRRIRQVLINLLDNAVKFTPEGGRVTLELTMVSTDDQRSLNYLRFAVKDTGIGIAEEDIKKLFQPFVQIDSSLNRQYEGTGLGLFLVKRIVDLHQGKVSVTSKAGVGSCFAFELPYQNITHPGLVVQPNPEPKLLTSEVESNQSPLVLLAEDNNANSTIISMYLQAKGYRVQTAHNGRIALELAQAETPNIILMDIQMPDMDGITAIEQMRQDSTLAKIPIIALTAFAMEEDKKNCLAAGATIYLAKPVRLKKLVQSIKKLL